MTPVVIDASAGVELVVDSMRGRALRRMLPYDAVPCVPDHFFAECGGVLRRWDINGILTAEQVRNGVEELLCWPLRVAQVRGLFADAWSMRANITFADGLYAALAVHLRASLLTCDGRLANTPLTVPLLYLP